MCIDKAVFVCYTMGRYTNVSRKEVISVSEKEKKIRESILEKLKRIDLDDLRIADAYAAGMLAERNLKGDKHERPNPVSK